MSISIKGKVSQILEVESGTSKAGKDWKKQSFVIDSGAQFNPLVCFSLFGEEKMAMLQGVEAGQEVEVFFNVSSREFNGKWYHNLDAWKVETSQSNVPTNDAPPPSEEPIGTLNTADLSIDEEEDDLPF